MNEGTRFGPTVHLLKVVQDSDAYNTTGRWQDKRGSPVVIQAIEMACLSACLSVGSRAATEEFSKDFNAVSGTVRLGALLAGRP